MSIVELSRQKFSSVSSKKCHMLLSLSAVRAFLAATGVPCADMLAMSSEKTGGKWMLMRLDCSITQLGIWFCRTWWRSACSLRRQRDRPWWSRSWRRRIRYVTFNVLVFMWWVVPGMLQGWLKLFSPRVFEPPFFWLHANILISTICVQILQLLQDPYANYVIQRALQVTIDNRILYQHALSACLWSGACFLRSYVHAYTHKQQ